MTVSGMAANLRCTVVVTVPVTVDEVSASNVFAILYQSNQTHMLLKLNLAASAVQ